MTDVSPGTNSSFGEFAVDTRVSAFAPWIDLVIDITPSTPDLSASSDTGVSNTDNITNDTTPTFIGTAEAGSTVTIFANGVAVGSGVATGGTYIITTSTLSNGLKSITARSTDISGNQSSLSGSMSITIDTVAPATPSVPDLIASSDSGASSTDNITNDSTPTFTGTAESGGTVTIFANGANVGSGVATGGTYNITTNTLSNGSKSITARVTDVAGNVSGTSAALSVTIDTVAPSTPAAPDLIASSDTGVSNTDNITNDSTPTFSGTAESGGTVTILANSVTVGTGVATGGTYNITTSTLSDGPKTIRARVTDVAGNVSNLSGSLSVTIDTTAPAAPSVPDLRSTSDSGVNNTDNLTNDSTPTFDFTAEAGGRAFIFAGGLVSGPVFGVGSQYTVTSNPLSDGEKIMRALVQDAAGNNSPLSNFMFIKVDTVAPRVQQVTVATTLSSVHSSYAIPTSSTSGAQLLRVPVFQPNRVLITFDHDLADLSFAPTSLPNLNGSYLQLFGLEGAAAYPLDSAVTYDAPSGTATWSITSPIGSPDQIELSLFDSVEDVAGNKLDAEGWNSPDSVSDVTANSTYPSGNGAPGGSLSDFRITLMPGDVIVDVNNAILPDNIINIDDLNDVRNNFGSSQSNPNLWQPGDADFDNDVDIDDNNLVRNFFGRNYTEWPGTGGGAFAASGSGAEASAATKGPQKTAFGEEAMKRALRVEFDRTIAIGKLSRYAGLFGWDKVGDANWWDEVLGSGWGGKLATAASAATDGRATEIVAAATILPKIELLAPRVATTTPMTTNPAATNLVLERTDFLDSAARIVDTIASPAESRQQDRPLRRSSRGHEVDARRLPTWDAALVAFEDATTSGAAQN